MTSLARLENIGRLDRRMHAVDSVIEKLALNPEGCRISQLIWGKTTIDSSIQQRPKRVGEDVCLRVQVCTLQ